MDLCLDMKCKYVLSRLEIYLNREIPPSERRHIQAHLAKCLECRQELDELDVLQNAIRYSLRLLATRAFPSTNTWERIQGDIHAGRYLLVSQPTHAEAILPGGHPLQFSNNWSGFCLPRGAWW